jgi:DNA-binding transcriptional LysR family regulator
MSVRDADWNDWRYFLEVARSGSTLSAARKLRVSQTTVARRIAALEEVLGLTLFERRSAGYAVTEAGETLVEQATVVEQAALAAEQQARAHGREASGTVRLTTEEVFASCLISPHLRDLHDRFPNVRIELDTSSAVRDLGAGEADIALRSSSKHQQSGVVGRLICRDDWTLYCSRDYASRYGVPRTIAALQQHSIIGGGGGHLAVEYNEWLEHAGLTHRVTMEQGSATGLFTAVRTGLGIAVLPCVIADAEPDFIRCAPPPENEKRQLWLLTHERVRHNPAVRAVIDFLYERLIAHVRRLERTEEAA